MSAAYDQFGVPKIKNPAYTKPVSDVLNSNRIRNPAYGNGGGFGGLGPGGGLNGVVANGSSSSGSTPYDVGYGAGFGPSSSPKSSIKLGGGGPDWASQILDDPAFMQLKNSLSAQGIADAAHLRGAIQQALIGFGAVPDLPSEVQQNVGLLDNSTTALADQNPFSTLKRLAQSYRDQQDAAKNQLAARGILGSGETGFQLGKIGEQNAGATYDATNSLLGSIGSLNDQYVAGQQAAAQQLAQGALTAETNVAQSNQGNPGTPGTVATWDPGSGLYKDPAGNFYDGSGNPVALPTQSTAPPVNSGNTTPTGFAPITGQTAPMYTPGLVQRPGTTNAFG